MRLLVVTTMRNEAPYLLEWVAWLRRMGVSDVLVYSNDCTDGTDSLLDALAAAGVLEHIRQDAPPKGRSVQWQALRAAWAHPLRKAADWAACLDCDEFPQPLDAPDLPAFLADLAGAEAVALPWRLFGNDGHLRSPDGLTTQSFLRAAPVALDYPPAGLFVKSFFRPEGPFNGFGVHRPKQKRAAVPDWRGPDGAVLPTAFARDASRINFWGQSAADAPAPKIQLNHYSLRSAESFLVKRDRGLPNRKTKDLGLNYWVERNFNTVSETGMQAHAEALTAEIAALRALPGVGSAEAGGRAWHAARFAHLMRDPATVQLYGRLALVPSSVPPPATVARGLVQAYTRAAIAQQRAQEEAPPPDD